MQRSTYAVAGVQTQPGVRMNVRSHVFVPDAEAGDEDQRQQYFAGNAPVQASRQPLTIRKGFAAAVLLAAFFLMAVLAAGRAVSLNRLRSTLEAESREIQRTKNELSAVSLELADAQDAMRIAYMAEQQYNMVYADRANAVPVTAPDTRYGRNDPYISGSREGSPLSPDHGMISGSR